MSNKDWSWSASGVVNGFMVVHDSKTMAWIEFLNDKLHGRTFMDFEQFVEKTKQYKIECNKMAFPAYFGVTSNKSNYYQDYLNLKYGL